MLHRLPFPRYVFPVTLFALTCAALVVLVAPTNAQAAALGDASVRSTLGQRLDVEVDIAALSPAEAASVSVKLAPPEAESSAGIDLGGLQRSLRLAVEKKEGRYQARITSDLAINEPFMHLLIELSANGVRTIRQYVLLIDPPELFNPPSGVANTAVAQVEQAPVKAASTRSDQVDDTAARQHSVKRGETLRTIAQQLQIDGVELEQLMVALIDSNPDAFAGNNMHRLRRGSLLTVPSPGVIRAVEPDQARHVLRTHTKDFARYQRQLAEHSALRPSSKSAAPTDTVKPATTQSSGGSVTVKMTDAGPTPKSQDKLTLSPPADQQRGARASDTAKATDAVVTDKALADANARIATLEKNISEMQSLLETKNRVLSGSQPPTASDATSIQNLPTPSVEGAAEKSGANPPVVPSAAPHSAPTSKQVPKQVPTQVPKPATLPGAVADQEVSLPQIDPWVGAIAAGGLLTFAILWRLQRRNHNRADGAAAAPVEPTLAQTMMAGAGGQQIDTAHSVFHSNFVPSLSQIDTHEVDAVAEADVYIAYGRDEQAEEILRDALRLHPERHTLRVKLLEIYAARKDRQRFNTLAAELHVLTQGQGPDWARAALLGQSLEPLDALYHASTSAAPVQASASIIRSSPMSAPLSDSSVGDRNIIHPPETTSPHVIDFNLLPITQTERSLDPSKSAAGDRPTTLGPMTQSAASSSMLNTKL